MEQVRSELARWSEKTADLAKEAPLTPKVGGRQRHVSDTAKSLEAKISSIHSDLRDLETADDALTDAIQTKIHLKLQEIRETYHAVAE
jgi:hypothetical protein